MRSPSQSEPERSPVKQRSNETGKAPSPVSQGCCAKEVQPWQPPLLGIPCITVPLPWGSCTLGLGTVILRGCSSSCLSEDGLSGEGKIAPCQFPFPARGPVNSAAWLSWGQGPGCALRGRVPQEGALLSRCPAAARAAAAGDQSQSLEQSCLCPCSLEDRQRGPLDRLISRLKG